MQTVSAAVHETAHSKLHDPKKYEIEPSWKVVMDSGGGTVRDFQSGFATEVEKARTVCYRNGPLATVDENRFEWRLEVQEDLTAVKQAAKRTATPRKWRPKSISYAVCQYLGVQTGENSFGYIASSFKDKELKELRASLETINKTSCELINDIKRNYKEICKERGIDLTAARDPERHPRRLRKKYLSPAPSTRRPCWCWMMPHIFMFSPAIPAGTTRLMWQL